MKVLIATDFRIARCDGRLFCNSAFCTILKRYYDAFGSIVLCTRVIESDEYSGKWEDITNIIEDVYEVNSLAKAYSNRLFLDEIIKECNMVIARVPSIIAYRAAQCAKKYNIPYFTESMGCAWDAYWNHGLVGKIIAPYMYFKMKSIVRNADYALYVTNEFLQKRYPCKNKSIAASNVLIEKVEDTVLQKRLDEISKKDYKNITLMTTAAIDVKYKGQEFVIKAIPALNKAGISVKYLIVGGGDDSYLKGVARGCGVEDQIKFTGRLGLDEVFELLDQTDIYLQPSLQEGLPRSVIEAMSRACPVIGARTAGIPELISDECVVERKSVKDIVNAIMRIANKDKLTCLAKENFIHSKEYLNDVLNERRSKFFYEIKKEIKLF